VARSLSSALLKKPEKTPSVFLAKKIEDFLWDEKLCFDSVSEAKSTRKKRQNIVTIASSPKAS